MSDGMFVKIEAVHDGLHPAMPIVDIRTADGEIAQFEVSRCSIVNGRIGVGWPVGRRADGALLIEPGSECISGGRHFGAWRVYVPAESLAVAEGTETGGGDGN